MVDPRPRRRVLRVQARRAAAGPLRRRRRAEDHALDRGASALWADCRAVLAVPTLRYLFVGVAVAFAGFNGLAYWLPSFWERQFDLSEGQAAGLTGVLGLTATWSGFWIGGVLGDRWHAERPNGRIELAAVTLVVGGALLAVSFAIGVLALQLPLMLCAAILIVTGLPSQTAAVADVLPAARRGIGYAVFTFLVAVSTALGPLVVGIVSDISGSLQTALIVMAVPCVPGGLVLARARRTYQADRLASRADGRLTRRHELTAGSRGRPSTTSPMMLRWISSVPPPMCIAIEPRSAAGHRPASGPSPPVRTPAGPSSVQPASASAVPTCAAASLRIEPSTPGIIPLARLVRTLAVVRSNRSDNVYTRASAWRRAGRP